jgi:hypothetical protein
VICRKRFIKKLRELKFSFVNRTKSERQELYMHKGVPIYVPRQDELLPQTAYAGLRKAGLSDAETKAFIEDSRNWPEREQPKRQ